MAEYVLDSDAPVGGILSRARLGAADVRFGGSKGVRGSALCWRETAVGGEVEKRRWVDVEVSNVG